VRLLDIISKSYNVFVKRYSLPWELDAKGNRGAAFAGRKKLLAEVIREQFLLMLSVFFTGFCRHEANGRR
jgi:hypothetical protein